MIFSLFQGVCVSERVSPWLPFWLCWQPFTFPPLENGCRVQLRTFWCAFQKGDRRKSVKGLLKLTKKTFLEKRTLAVWLFCQPCVASRVQQQIPVIFASSSFFVTRREKSHLALVATRLLSVEAGKRRRFGRFWLVASRCLAQWRPSPCVTRTDLSDVWRHLLHLTKFCVHFTSMCKAAMTKSTPATKSIKVEFPVESSLT